MTSLWSRLEPLLDRVRTPARYIGSEDRVNVTGHGQGELARQLADSEVYEVELLSQGQENSYETRNERPDADTFDILSFNRSSALSSSALTSSALSSSPLAESIGEPTDQVVVAIPTTSGRGIRPTESVEVVVPGCDPWNHLGRVLRINQWIERDGERLDVLTGRPAHAQVCV